MPQFIRILWLLATCGRVLTLGRVAACGLTRTYPVFSAWLAYSLIQTAFLAWCDQYGGGQVTYTRWWARLAPVGTAAQAFVTLEAYWAVMKHLRNIRIAGWLFLGIFGALSVAAVLATADLGEIWKGLVAERLALIRGYSLACMVILALGRLFVAGGVEIRRNVSYLADGLICRYGAESLSMAIMLITRDPWFGLIAHTILQAGNIASAIFWWRINPGGEEFRWPSDPPPGGGSARDGALEVYDEVVRAASGR